MSVAITGSTAFRFPLLGILAAVGCEQSPSMMPTSSDTFEYKATAAWSSLSTPNVKSMTIDGQPYASGEFYTVDETFASYDDARASFVPKTVVFTTTTDTTTFQIDLGAFRNPPAAQHALRQHRSSTLRPASSTVQAECERGYLRRYTTSSARLIKLRSFCASLCGTYVGADSSATLT